MSEFLRVAKEAACEAAGITLKYYRRNPEVSIKADRTPVTVADKEAENAIVEIIRSNFPDHRFHGEEFGDHGISRSDSEYTWIIDPIDGTKNFIAGIPLWGTLIALRKSDEIILGLSHIPCMEETLWAEKGTGAFLNGERVQVSACDSLAKGMISYGSFPAFVEIGREKQLIELIKTCHRQRSFGDCWPYHLLASGKLEIVVEAKIKIVDVAPFDLIIREAGGEATDITGEKIGDNPASFLATNGRVHREALSLLKK